MSKDEKAKANKQIAKIMKEICELLDIANANRSYAEFFYDFKRKNRLSDWESEQTIRDTYFWFADQTSDGVIVIDESPSRSIINLIKRMESSLEQTRLGARAAREFNEALANL